MGPKIFNGVTMPLELIRMANPVFKKPESPVNSYGGVLGNSFIDALCKSSDEHTVNLSLFFESNSDNLHFFSGRLLFISSAVMDSKGYQSYQKWSVGTHNSHSRLKHVHNEANKYACAKACGNILLRKMS